MNREEEEARQRRETLEAKDHEILEASIGKTIVCDDGIARKVVEATYSLAHGRGAFVIINEKDPDSNLGHWCHILSLTCQVLGAPKPTQENMDALTRMSLKTTHVKAGQMAELLKGKADKGKLELDD